MIEGGNSKLSDVGFDFMVLFDCCKEEGGGFGSIEEDFNGGGDVLLFFITSIFSKKYDLDKMRLESDSSPISLPPFRTINTIPIKIMARDVKKTMRKTSSDNGMLEEWRIGFRSHGSLDINTQSPLSLKESTCDNI